MTACTNWRRRPLLALIAFSLSLALGAGSASADTADRAAQALDACRFQEAKSLIESLGASTRRRELADRFRAAAQRETKTQELFQAAEERLSEGDHEGALESLGEARRNTACESYATTIDRAFEKARQRWSEALRGEVADAARACDFVAASKRLDRMAQSDLPGLDTARADLAAAYAYEKVTFEIWKRARAARRNGEAATALGLLLDAGFHTRCGEYGRKIIVGAAQIAGDVEAARADPDWDAAAAAWAGQWQGSVKIDRFQRKGVDASATGLRTHMASAADAYRQAVEAGVAPNFADGSTPLFGSMIALYRLALASAGVELIDLYVATAETGVPVALATAPATDGLRLVVPGKPRGRNDAEALLRPLKALPTLRPLGRDVLYGVAALADGLSIVVRLSRDSAGGARLEAVLATLESEEGFAEAMGLDGLWIMLSADLLAGAPAWLEYKARLDAIIPAKAEATDRN